ncbi:MAG: hypothetical protein GWP70_13020 [Proteobacteria bacterium]|nr:hypothetical protein [Pseudomonadota bacterium]
MSSSRPAPQFVADPVLKAARQRRSFEDAQMLANPRYTKGDGFAGVDGVKAFGVALNPQSGQVVGTEVATAEPQQQPEAPVGPTTEQAPSDAHGERIAALEAQLNAQLAEHQTVLAQAKAQAFAEGQAQGQQEAKQMLDMENQSAGAEQLLELRDMIAEFVGEARDHLIAHQDLFDPIKQLALALAEQIARCELSQSDASMTQFIEQSLAEIDPLQLSELVIYVSSDWYERLQQPELEAIFADYTLRRDDTLQVGSVRLAVQDTSINDFIDQRIARLSEQLLASAPAVAQEAAHSDETLPVAMDDEDFFAGEFDDQGAIIPGDYSEVDDIFFQRPEEDE